MIKKLMNTSFPLHYVFRFINSIVLICLLLFLFSCSVIEILPGLCYTDKDGTYLCSTEQEKPKQNKLDCNKYGLIEYCEKSCYCVNHNDMSRVTDFLWR